MKRTNKGKITDALRKMWLRSLERAEALKRDNYTCQICKRKASRAKGKEFKVQVHHIAGIKAWDDIIDLIVEEILCDPSMLITLCHECHKEKKEK